MDGRASYKHSIYICKIFSAIYKWLLEFTIGSFSQRLIVGFFDKARWGFYEILRSAKILENYTACIFIPNLSENPTAYSKSLLTIQTFSQFVKG